MTAATYAKIPTEALAIARKLTKSQYDIWTYLWEIDPYGNHKRQLPTPADIAKELGLHERTVTRACDKLQDLGLFEFEIQRWACLNNYGSKSDQAKEKFTKKISNPTSTESGCYDTDVQNLTTRSNFGHSDPKIDTDVQNLTQRSNFGQDCQNQDSEDAPQGAFTPSHKDINKDINKSLINPLITGVNDFSEREEEDLENCDQENLDQENSEEEFLREEILQEAKITDSENAENQIQKFEKPIKKGRQAETHQLQTQNSIRETTLNIQNLEVDHSSAAAPRFFANLLEFVTYEAKADPKINAPEIWADTVIRRNPEVWQEKWDTWEKSRTQTVTGLPEKVEIDFEASKRALEEARKLLPPHLRRHG